MAKGKEPRSLSDMAAEAAGDGVACPDCGCRDWRTYRTIRGNRATFRYKACRHCGKKVYTTSQTAERIVREVKPPEDDDDGILALIG